MGREDKGGGREPNGRLQFYKYHTQVPVSSPAHMNMGIETFKSFRFLGKGFLCYCVSYYLLIWFKMCFYLMTMPG